MSNSVVRDSLEGSWILDKTRGEWSMKEYLSTMDVDPLAIEAHEKGELEQDTIHTISFVKKVFKEENDDNDEQDEDDMDTSEAIDHVKIVKRSRVNNDIAIELPLEGERERVETLSPGNRTKKMKAKVPGPDRRDHLEIHSTLQTVNGVATVIDVKKLVQEEESDGTPQSVMVQTLTITNTSTGKSSTTTRHFKPYLETPPHLVPTTDAPAPRKK